MKILAVIPHYFHCNGGSTGLHGSLGNYRAGRVHALGMCISGLHRLLGGSQSEISPVTAASCTANDAVRADVHVVVLTCQNRHVLDDLSIIRSAFEHQPVVCPSMELGFAGRGVLRDQMGGYDYYCYLEDDLVLHDPWFFIKLRHFCEQAGDEALLQPNRYEYSRSADPLKVYIDGPLPERLTARFQDASDRPEITMPVLGLPVIFRRAVNPHSGCYFLNAAQMEYLSKQPYFFSNDANFVGPLESAASLGIMRTFRVYKPAIEFASFLEVQHWGDGWIRRLSGRPRKDKARS